MKVCKQCKKEKEYFEFMSSKQYEFKTCNDCRNYKKHYEQQKKEKQLQELVQRICPKEKDFTQMSIELMISKAKYEDILQHHFEINPKHFIDEEFITQKIKKSMMCPYCNVQMQFLECNRTFCTLLRKNPDF